MSSTVHFSEPVPPAEQLRQLFYNGRRKSSKEYGLYRQHDATCEPTALAAGLSNLNVTCLRLAPNAIYLDTNQVGFKAKRRAPPGLWATTSTYEIARPSALAYLHPSALFQPTASAICRIASITASTSSRVVAADPLILSVPPGALPIGSWINAAQCKPARVSIEN